jgi:signal transduction histidine kinase
MALVRWEDLVPRLQTLGLSPTTMVVGLVIGAFVWGGVFVSVCNGEHRSEATLLRTRICLLGIFAWTCFLFRSTNRFVWVIPSSVFFAFCVVAWWQIDQFATGRNTARRTGLVVLSFCLGASSQMGGHNEGNQRIWIFAGLWFAMGLLQIGLNRHEQFWKWTAFSPFILMIGPILLALRVTTPTLIATTAGTTVGIALLVDRMRHERFSRMSATETLNQLERRHELNSMRSDNQQIEVAARTHDQVAALYSVETTMVLLERTVRGDVPLDLTPDEQGRLMQSLRDEVVRARRLAKTSVTAPRAYDLAELLTPSLSLIQTRSPHVSVSLRPGMRAIVDGDALIDAVRNLVFNALEHGQGKSVSVVGQATFSGYQITVSDKGPGVPSERRDHIFERGVGSERGGHGLPNAREALQRMGGSLHLKSADDGATFEIHIPAAHAGTLGNS